MWVYVCLWLHVLYFLFGNLVLLTLGLPPKRSLWVNHSFLDSFVSDLNLKSSNFTCILMTLTSNCSLSPLSPVRLSAPLTVHSFQHPLPQHIACSHLQPSSFPQEIPLPEKSVSNSSCWPSERSKDWYLLCHLGWNTYDMHYAFKSGYHFLSPTHI